MSGCFVLRCTSIALLVLVGPASVPGQVNQVTEDLARVFPGTTSDATALSLAGAMPTASADVGLNSYFEPTGDPLPACESADCDCPSGVDSGSTLWTCEHAAARVFSLFYGYDAWRGISDGAWTNNGLHAGLNFGTRLGRLSEVTGIGLQIGGSVGVYDWAGTDYRLANQDQPTTQGFVTCGFFRRASEHSNWSAAVVQDWMINNNYSVMGEDSTLYQWRVQLGRAISDWNEIGVWGAWRGRGDTRTVGFMGPVTWQPINQLNFFWHHKWDAGQADTWIWFGVPEQDRLAGGGTLGDYLVGAFSWCPITDRLGLYSMVNYMHQSASPGPDAAKEDAWNFYVGVAFYPRRLARSRTVKGHTWAPLVPVANNGLFLVDASRTY